jgi:hypothetical protein
VARTPRPCSSRARAASGATRGLTSIWKPERQNHLVVFAQGRSFHLSELHEQWL